MGRTAVIAGTATVTSAAVGGAMQKNAMKKQAAAEQQMAAQAQPAEQEQQPLEAQAAAPSGGMTQETIDKLKQLADLKAAGILTEEEFEQQKALLLA
jgi:hypothetical protein